MYLVSVVIPVKNGGFTLEACLRSLQRQTIGKNIQIIVLDSMSGDNSKEIAKRYNAEIINVPEGTFDHGLTRNIGIKHSKADLIFFTVQDARIAEADMLEKMVNHFFLDEQVMAVCGHQAVPHEKDKNPVLWRKIFSKPELKIKELNDVAAFQKLNTIVKKDLLAWDNVVAMYRKKALVIQPFEQTHFAEDWIWSYRALLKGWKLLYDPGIFVYHYHHSSFSYAFRVNYTLNFHFYKHFQLLPTPPAFFIPLLKHSYHLFRNEELRLGEKLYWVLHNAQVLAATKLSVMHFLMQLHAGGEKQLDKAFSKYCKHVPQGLQKRQIA